MSREIICGNIHTRIPLFLVGESNLLLSQEKNGPLYVDMSEEELFLNFEIYFTFKFDLTNISKFIRFLDFFDMKRKNLFSEDILEKIYFMEKDDAVYFIENLLLKNSRLYLALREDLKDDILDEHTHYFYNNHFQNENERLQGILDAKNVKHLFDHILKGSYILGEKNIYNCLFTKFINLDLLISKLIKYDGIMEFFPDKLEEFKIHYLQIEKNTITSFKDCPKEIMKLSYRGDPFTPFS